MIMIIAADQIVDPIEKAIERLASSLRFIRDEQAYMYIRDRVHNKSMLKKYINSM